tara:strand:+ start:48415 stop:49470 length:1056 start_codon:yes stop_codon:yes gene_type:complete
MIALKSNLQNMIINGGFDFWQRATSFTQSGGFSGYYCDRFDSARSFNSGSYNIDRSTDVPAGQDLTYSLKATGSSVNLNWFAINQKMETNFSSKINDMNGNVTVSLWVKSSKTGSFSVFLRNSAETVLNDAMYFKSLTIDSANTWERKEFYIPATGLALTKGALTDASWILGVTLKAADLGVEGWQRYDSSASGSVDFDFTGNDEFWMTGLMLHEGDVAQDFQRAGRDVTEELRLCQRYFEKSYTLTKFAGDITDAASARFVRTADDIGQRVGTSLAGKFVTEKRAAPLVSFYNHRGNGAQNAFSRYNADDNLAMTNNTGSSTKGIDGYFQAGVNLSDSIWGFHFYADAEL